MKNFTKSRYGSPTTDARQPSPDKPAGRDPYTVVPNHDGVLLSAFDSLPSPSTPNRRLATGSNLDAHHDREAIVDAHAVEFSKTAGPPEGGFPLGETDRDARAPLGGTERV